MNERMKNLRVVIVLLALMLIAAMPVFVRERISIMTKEDVWVYDGADVLLGSSDLSHGNFDTTYQTIGLYGDMGHVKVAAPTSLASATPAVLVDSAGLGNLLEVRDAATPAIEVYNGGGMRISAPTSVATAKPALVIDSLGVSVLFEVRDAATPQVIVANGGSTEIKQGLDVDGAVTLNNTVDIDGNISSGTGVITITDNVLIDGQADAVQLTVQGYTTQTNNILTVEQSDGTDVITATNAGALYASDLLAMDDLTVVDDTSLGDDVTIGGWGTFTAQTTLTVTQDGTITPTGTYQGLVNYTGAVQTGSMAVGTAGQLLVLTNIGSNAITISDTGTIMLSGDIALGQYDTLTLFSDGTNWLQLATSNN